jgi:hypothetical protein
MSRTDERVFMPMTMPLGMISFQLSRLWNITCNHQPGVRVYFSARRSRGTTRQHPYLVITLGKLSSDTIDGPGNAALGRGHNRRCRRSGSRIRHRTGSLAIGQDRKYSTTTSLLVPAAFPCLCVTVTVWKVVGVAIGSWVPEVSVTMSSEIDIPVATEPETVFCLRVVTWDGDDCELFPALPVRAFFADWA